MKKHSRKKGMMLVNIGLFLIVAVSLFFVISQVYKIIEKTSYAGEIGLDAFDVYIEGENALFYIDSAAKLSGQQAIIEVSRKGGFIKRPKCGDYSGFNLWSNESQDCEPELQENIAERIDINLNRHIERFDGNPELIEDNYEYFMIGNSMFDIVGTANDEISILDAQFFKGIGDPLGHPPDKNNEIIDCRDNKCVANQAKHYARAYDSLPYCLGCESPYTYEMTDLYNRQMPQSSVFKYTDISKYDAYGHLTVPGFDCSGFVWWVMRHSNVADFYYRLTAEGYLQKAEQGGAQQICEGESCTLEKIKSDAEPGDILFIHPKRSDGYRCDREVCHIAVYLGKEKIAHSTGSRGVVDEKIPESYLPDGEIGIHSVYRFDPLKTETGQPPVVSQTYDSPSGMVSSIQYSIDPSFELKLDYDFADYGHMRKAMETIKDKCVKNLDKDCINETVKDPDNDIEFTQTLPPVVSEISTDLDYIIEYHNEIVTFDDLDIQENESWGEYCETKEEQVLYDFIELWDRCAKSAKNTCYCRFDLDLSGKPRYSKDRGFGKDYEFKAYNLSDGTYNIYLDSNPDLEYNLNLSPYDLDFIERYRLEAWNMEAELTADGRDENTDHIAILKKGNRLTIGEITPLGLYFSPIKQGPDVLLPVKCDMPKILKVCVIKERKKYPFYDTLQKELSMSPAVYRFSYWIDVPPPIHVQDVEIYDNLRDDGSVIVKWKENPEPNIEKYEIYLTKDNNVLSDLTIAELESKISDPADDDVKKYTVNTASATGKNGTIDLFYSYFNPELGENVYVSEWKFFSSTEYYANKLDMSGSYHFFDGEYVHVLAGLDDNEQYYFTVLAVDDAGRKQRKFEYHHVMKGASIDDTYPESVRALNCDYDPINDPDHIFCFFNLGDDYADNLNIKTAFEDSSVTPVAIRKTSLPGVGFRAGDIGFGNLELFSPPDLYRLTFDTRLSNLANTKAVIINTDRFAENNGLENTKGQPFTGSVPVNNIRYKLGRLDTQWGKVYEIIPPGATIAEDSCTPTENSFDLGLPLGTDLCSLFV